MASFEELLKGVDRTGGVVVPASWMQGRATFGGLVAAVMLRQARHVCPSERRVRSLNLSFVGPLGDNPASVDTVVLRAGRSLTHLETTLHEGPKVRAKMLLSAGSDRPSVLSFPAAPRPVSVTPDAGVPLPNTGPIPVFTQHFDYRITSGNLPFSGAKEPRLHGWIRHRTPTTSVLEAAVAMLDAWPAPVLPALPRPAPASSVSWTTHVLDLPASMDEGWWYYEAESQHTSAGYSVMRARLWAPDGRMALWSDQLQVIFG